jgi:hypothetical protein
VRPLPKLLVTAASASVLAACPLIATADALAAPAARTTAIHINFGHGTMHPAKGGHGGTHGGGHGHGGHGRSDRLAGPRRGAAHAIGAQLRAVSVLVMKAGAAAGPDDADLKTALTADLDAVKADLAGVAGATSKSQLHSLLRDADNARQVAGVQFRLVSAADEFAPDVDQVASDVEELQVELDAMVADLMDVTTQQDALDQANDGLATMSDDLSASVDAALGLSPDAGHRAVQKAQRAAHAALNRVEAALEEAQADVLSVQEDLHMAPPSGSSSNN